jgi:ABC-type transport system involved in cytochrome c biogenesis ATPase subunit
MRLANVRVRGFQSYLSEQNVKLDPELTILAGQNNVGKTALLRSIRQIADPKPGAAPNFMVEYEWEISADDIGAAFVYQGQKVLSDHLPHEGTRIRARFETELPALPGLDIDSGVDARTGPHALIEAEIMGTDLIARPRRHSNGIRLWWAGPGFGNETETVVGISHLWTLVQRLFSGSIYIQPRRTGAQPMQFQVTTALEPDGSNLTTVIATLYTNFRASSFRRLEEFICAAFTDVARIDVVMGAGSPPLATVNLVYGSEPGQIVPLMYCGTGIEQMLMLATAVLTAGQPQVFLIDEPHAFLHPSAERHLLRFMKNHPEHQYVVATHSPVFLNSAALGQARLITRSTQGSVVRDVSDLAEVLEAVGVTAADLWSADGILWIEGPSDRKVAEAIVAVTDGLADVSIRVVPMPDWIRSTASSAAKAQATVDFCEAVRLAVVPVRVESLFVFDGDERPDGLRTQIVEATQDRARFLAVREVENLFLRSTAIQPVLAEVCAGANRRVPTVQDVEADLNSLLAATANQMFYRVPVNGPDRTKVVGSRVLDALWWKWALAAYDKVEDGPRLVARILAQYPEDLQPFLSLVSELAISIRAARSGRQEAAVPSGRHQR